MAHKRLGNDYEQGYDNYSSSKTFDEVFPGNEAAPYQSRGYYLRCGWSKAEKDAKERERLERRERCPICGYPMDDYDSGGYCTNEAMCKYHTHKDIIDRLEDIEYRLMVLEDK